MAQSNRGGAREGAGRPHEHQDYLLIEVIDAWGGKDLLVAGLYLDRTGQPSTATMNRAEDIAAHHVNEGAQSVRILKKTCCVIREAEELKRVTEGRDALDFRDDEERKAAAHLLRMVEEEQ